MKADLFKDKKTIKANENEKNYWNEMNRIKIKICYN